MHSDDKPPPSAIAAWMGVLGVVIYALALGAVQGVQFNVVSYKVVRTDDPIHLPALLFACLVFGAIVGLAVLGPGLSGRRGRRRWVLAGSCLWPLAFAMPVVLCRVVGWSIPFVFSVVMVLSAGWAAFRAALYLPAGTRRPWGHGAALGSIILLIMLLTAVHTRLQINFFEHFMLGHADFGHFAEELKNCLAGRGLRSDSFDNVRLGWHFVPLLYVLVPGYALWPSPVYLMVCGALLVHVVALPAYCLVRRLTGSAMLGWMVAVAWLLLPSQSRLVYSGTYGFQWIYFAMPLLGVMIAAAVTGHWRLSCVMVILVLLCKETTTALTLGWGAYLVLFTARRRLGIVIMVGSVAYLMLCTQVLIPHFAAEGRYERFTLFGELGGGIGDLLSAPFTQPDVFFGRFLRWEVLYFLLLLPASMGLLPLRGWRISIAALPTLIMILLLKNPDWLSIKFWHHATVLPVLFFAAIATFRPDEKGARKPSRSAKWVCGHSNPSAAAVAMLVCAAMGHYFHAFSPLGKAYEPYADAAYLHRPDPRMTVVRRLREDIPRHCTILATERLAAHFTDYRRVYTGGRIQPADFVILDRHDTWDSSGLPGKAPQFTADPQYHLHSQYGSIIVYQRSQ